MLFPTLRVTTVALVVLITGCAGTYKPKIPQKLKDSIATVEVFSFISQEEIDMQFNYSNAGVGIAVGVGGAVGGMMGAMVDGVVNHSLAKNAEQRVQPYRDKLVEYDFNSTHLAQLKKSLHKVDWVKINKLESEINREDFKLHAYMRKIKHDSLLIIRTSYSVSPDFEVINVSSFCDLFVKPKQKSKLKKPKFHAKVSQYYQYQSPSKKQTHLATLPDFVARRDKIIAKYQATIENARRPGKKSLYQRKKREEIEIAAKKALKKSPMHLAWTADELKEQLNKGIDHVLTMLTIDLNDQRSSKEYKALEEKISLINFHGEQRLSEVYLIDSYQGHNFYRTRDGSLFSVPEGDTLRNRAELQ